MGWGGVGGGGGGGGGGGPGVLLGQGPFSGWLAFALPRAVAPQTRYLPAGGGAPGML